MKNLILTLMLVSFNFSYLTELAQAGNDDVNPTSPSPAKERRQVFQSNRYQGFSSSLGFLSFLNRGNPVGQARPSCGQYIWGSFSSLANRGAESFYSWLSTERSIKGSSGKLTVEFANGSGKEVFQEVDYKTKEKKVGYNQTQVIPQSKFKKSVGGCEGENKSTCVVHLGQVSQNEKNILTSEHDKNVHEVRNDISLVGPSVKLGVVSVAPIAEQRNLVDVNGTSEREGLGLRVSPFASKNVYADVLHQTVGNETSLHVKAKLNIPVVGVKLGVENQWHFEKNTLSHEEIMRRVRESRDEALRY